MYQPPDPISANAAGESQQLSAFERSFLNSVQKRLLEYKVLGDRTLAQLSAAELNFAPAAGSNSIAVIIRHLQGNMFSRWTNFLTEDGEKPWRDREREFSTKPASKEELLMWWEEGWDCLLSTLESLTPNDLARTVFIRSEPILAVDAILRQVAHYCSHIGQIVYLGKLIRGDNWQSLSIPPGGSEAFNCAMQENHGGQYQ